MYYYQVYSLKIASDIPIRALTNRRAGFDAHDVRVRLGSTPDALSQNVPAVDLCATLAENEFLFYNEKLGVRIAARNGRDIIIDRTAYRDRDAVSVYLLGNVLGAVLYMRGIIPLRASAIMTEQGAVLFTGATGAGKSTLVCALLRSGYPLIADGIAPINPQNAHVLPGVPRLKLWQDSLQYNKRPTQASSKVRKSLNKYYVRVPDALTDGSFPIHKIYHLKVHSAEKFLIAEQTARAQKLHLLQNNLYHLPYAAGLNRESIAAQTAARLADMPQATLARPQHPVLFEKIVRLVERDFAP